MIGNDVVDLALARRESNWQRRGFLAKLFTPSEQQLIHEAAEPERMVWLLWSMKESAYKSEVRLTGIRRFAPLRLSCSLTEYTAKSVVGLVSGEFMHQTTSSLTVDFVATVALEASHLAGIKVTAQPFALRQAQDDRLRVRGQPVRILKTIQKQPVTLSLSKGRALATAMTKEINGLSAFFRKRDYSQHAIFPLSDTAVQQQLFQDIHQATGMSPEAISLHKNELGVPSLQLTHSSGGRTELSVSLSHHGRFGAYALLKPAYVLRGMRA